MHPDLILKTAKIHGFITILLCSSVYFAMGQYNALSCLYGGIIMGFSLIALIWAWQQIYRKKLIAIAVGVIVSKYAILGMITFYLLVNNKVDFIGFIIGLSSMPLTALALLGFAEKAQSII